MSVRRGSICYILVCTATNELGVAGGSDPATGKAHLEGHVADRCEVPPTMCVAFTAVSGNRCAAAMQPGQITRDA